MTCAEIRPLLHAYIDDELDLAHGLEIESHLKSCPACISEENRIRSLRAAFRENDLAYRAPGSLRQQIRSAVGISRVESRDYSWCWKWIAAGATAAAVLAIFLRPAAISGRDQLLAELVDGHVRSLQANHLTDVASSDQHTVKPWFNGKLDFAPDVKDFVDQGFPLVGGRLDYLGSRTVAALVYRHNKHLINVFVWPEENAPAAEVGNYHGYSVVGRDVKGMRYYLVSDLNPAELEQLARLMTP
ncbi:MAG TPA: zf-HC2 domain-containing protein [Desulfuromonadaceae bacterium]|nr:zf-HC2 domain-containing protein [Desulfuromonadaceae bacterium]